MSVGRTEGPEYGNWVSAKLVYGSFAMSILFFVLAFVSLRFLVGALMKWSRKLGKRADE
jgi:hypothetical protein